MQIEVKKLFLSAVLLEVGFSATGWYISDPWVFGFALPLVVMGVYIWLGTMRGDGEVPDDRFADSCYYLGFIFTLSSIVFGLFDLPLIGTKISEVVVRFGAAMVSTVLGLIVRVYWVNFRADDTMMGDAVEGGAFAASQRLREQISTDLGKIREFDIRVDESVTRAAHGVETLTEETARKITEFCAELMAQNKLAFTDVLQEVREASKRLASSVDAYAITVTRRMEGVTFPEDYFSKRLEAPVAKLGSITETIADRITGVAGGMIETLGDLRPTVSEVRSRADEITDTLARIIELATIQERIVSGTQSQIDTLGLLSDTLQTVQEDIAKVAEAASTQAQSVVLHANSTRIQNVGLLASTKELTAIRQALTLANTGISAIHRLLTESQDTGVASIEAALRGVTERLDTLAVDRPQPPDGAAGGAIS
jgi:low affinity Fe/Cu permease